MSGVSKLGGLLRGQMHAVSKYETGETNLRFGTIESGLALKPDGLSYTVPRGDYLVCASCADALAVGDRVVVGQIGSNYVILGILS